ncbi:kelch repeat and BTB domain-containing protein 11-like [Branchiostoma floridae]|uniref:Kelch repeat and BTB domain-containing protein 11-like n=1 Tax=Branchiostoma floridae TaxID=7739 RepID=A0A9J7KY35_BRAFL|nr:kelch repeat and BTB domain-containing protein 11-like [Branchiostoma floridae]
MEPDVTILVQGQPFRLSKEALVRRSEYFRGMFESGMKESSQDVIEVQRLSSATFSILAGFIASSSLAVDGNSLEDVIEGIAFLQMQDAVPACIDFLKTYLSFDNCLEVIAIAEKHAFGQIVDAVFDFLGKDYLAFSRTETFQTLQDEEKERTRAVRYRGRQHLAVTRKEGCIPGSGKNVRDLFYYVEGEQKWKSFTQLPDDCSKFTINCSTAVVDNYLYIIGVLKHRIRSHQRPKSREGPGCVSRFYYEPINYQYNPLLEKWEKIPPFVCGRKHFSLVALRDGLFAIGGITAESTLADGKFCESVERFDVFTERWSHCSPVPVQRYEVRVSPSRDNPPTTSVKDVIFTLLTCHGGLFLKQYCPTDDRWTDVSPGPLPGRVPCIYRMFSHEDDIFILGGNPTIDRSIIVRYDPADRQWTPLRRPPPLRVEYFNAFGVVLEGKLYTGSGETRQIDRYDLDEQQWEGTSQTLMPALGPLEAFTIYL